MDSSIQPASHRSFRSRLAQAYAAPAAGPLPTAFAPAERADAVTLAADARFFAEQPLLRQILAAVPEMFIVLNEQRQIVFANSALYRLLSSAGEAGGEPAVEAGDEIGEEDSLIGLRPGEALDCQHAFDTPGGCGTTEFCRSCGALRAIINSLGGNDTVQDCRILRQDGSSLDLRVWATPLHVEGRTFSLFTVQDISHEKRRTVLERLFFHDILNTVTAIAGFSTLLNDASPNEIDGLREAISQLSGQLVEEVQAQQLIVAAEEGELALEPSPLNSRALLQEAVELARGHQSAAGRTLRVALTAQSVWFVSDKTLVRRVLMNLVRNALEACAPGDTVTLSSRSAPGHVELSVHNPGAMPRAVQMQLFQRSFSTKGRGRGLGLYSIRLFGERYLGGQVWFTSSPEGITFTVSLPLSLEERKAGAARE